MTKKTIAEFPSISEIQKEVDDNPLAEAPKSPKGNKVRQWIARWLIIGLGLLVVALVVFNLIRSPAGQRMLGSGSVTGVAVINDQKPVQADIFIPGSDYAAQSGADGSFTLANIPAGKQNIVIAFDGIGQEIPVQIEAGKTVNIGTIKLATTQVPP